MMLLVQLIVLMRERDGMRVAVFFYNLLRVDC